MTTQQKIEALIQADTKIQLVRGRETLLTLPLADAKLVRVARYIKSQIAELEAEAWQEAGMDHV